MRLYKLRNTSNINFYGDIHFINEDAGENYVIKLSKIRSGEIVPAVTDADILEIYAMLKYLQISEERQNEAIHDLNAKTDTDLLGSIL